MVGRSLFALILGIAVWPIQAPPLYYVDTVNGRDSNPGTSDAPWKTIQKAADMVEGGIVNVRAGRYNERVLVTRSGSAATPITFQAEAGTIMQGFTIQADHIQVAGFEITNSNISYAHGTGISIQGQFNDVRDNYIHDLLFGEGIWLYGGPGRDAAYSSNNTIAGNRIVRARNAGMVIEGVSNLVQDNDISHTIQSPRDAPPRQGADADGIRFFGSGHVFRRNYIHDISLTDPGNPNPHIDAFQTWGPCSDMVIEQNVVWQMESGDQGVIIEGLIQPVTGITIRNNIFMTNGTGYAPAVLAGDLGPVTAINVVNNTMVALNGPSEYAIWLFGNVKGAVVKNNATYDHGNSSEPYIRIDSGASELAIGFNSVFTTNGQPPAGLPFPGDLWMVNPQFTDLAGRDFRLRPSSPLINAGTPLAVVPDDFQGRARLPGTNHIGALGM
jgi:parallel beta-helix repeat protein